MGSASRVRVLDTYTVADTLPMYRQSALDPSSVASSSEERDGRLPSSEGGRTEPGSESEGGLAPAYEPRQIRLR
eukprot:6172255-Pleurochrysis_carterae.AAC.1